MALLLVGSGGQDVTTLQPALKFYLPISPLLVVAERLAGIEARRTVARQIDYPYRWTPADGSL